MPNSSILILQLQTKERQWHIGVAATEQIEDHKVESSARMKRNKARKLMFVPDSASMLSTFSLLCFRDRFKAGNHFLFLDSLLPAFKKSIGNQKGQSHSRLPFILICIHKC